MYLLLLISTLLFVLTNAWDCPSEIDFSPCECSEHNQGLIIQCIDSDTAEFLQAIGYVQQPIFSLTIEGGTIQLPPTAFQNKEIREIVIRDTNIQELEPGIFQNVSGLKEIDLSDNIINKISNGTFSSLLFLEKLELDTNEISEIEPGSFRNMPKLKHLDLSYNRLTTLRRNTFINVPNLRWLRIEYNTIRQIQRGALSALTNLNYLLLSDNNIHTLGKEDFANLGSLRHLVLDYNSIRMVDKDAFKDLISLRTLDLGNNEITSFPEGIFRMFENGITYINFKSNPFDCDCRLVWFKSWLMERVDIMGPKQAVSCNSPRSLRGQPLLDINMKNFVC